MFETGLAGSTLVSRVADALEHLAAAQHELVGLDPTVLSRDELLDLVEVLETNARRHTAVGCELIAELDGRGVAGELGYPSTGVLLAERLRIGRREAAGRVRVASDLGLRRAVTGETLEPRFPHVAAALAEGTISARHGYHRHGRPAARPGAHRAAGVGGPGRTNPGRPCAETRSGSARGAGPHRGDLSGPGRAAGRRAGPPAAPICRLGGPAEWLRPADGHPHRW